jgi:tRNA-2-methylthio-N6-dimethylallyladenosine synthase
VALQEDVSLQKNRELVGSRVELLIEGPGRKALLAGRTRTNKLVHLDGSMEPGEFTMALVREAHPHHLDAEPVDDHRTALLASARP